MPIMDPLDATRGQTADVDGDAFTTRDAFGRTGSPGMVLVTVQPGQQLKLSLNGEIFVAQGITFGVNSGAGPVTVAERAWMFGREAVDARRDGIVTF